MGVFAEREQGFYPRDRGQVQRTTGQRDCLLLGLYPSGDDWFGVLVAKAGGRLDYWFKHVFTPKEVQAVFMPLGGIDAVYGRFYAEFLGMQVTI